MLFYQEIVRAAGDGDSLLFSSLAAFLIKKKYLIKNKQTNSNGEFIVI